VDSLRDAVRDTEIEIRGFREEAEPIACHAPTWPRERRRKPPRSSGPAPR
jgi:hypothetical protein